MPPVESPPAIETAYAIRKARLEIREDYRIKHGKLFGRFLAEAEQSKGIVTNSYTTRLANDFRLIETRAKEAGIAPHVLRKIQTHVFTVDFPYTD